jgi:hypothetical protein
MQRGNLRVKHGSWELRYWKPVRVGGKDGRSGQIERRQVSVAIAPSSESREVVQAIAERILRPINTQRRQASRFGKEIERANRRIGHRKLSWEEREAKIASQGHQCAICRTKNPGHNGWCFDHDHITGKERDALCSNCNVALGMVHDDEGTLLDMILYLRRHRAAPR